MSKKTITVQQVKSTIGCNQSQIATVRGLGFRRMYQTKTLPNTPAVRGMIKKVIHLVSVVSEN
jgi:large subunit ribosomal protein L30